ncbi:MAG: group II intron reverse transcriptase/maturase [Candidatus Brocadiaceae bacterium]|nr:group II intron reverse transcriptase/maturase [Candidatus Brocadiaceae bacterium]
MGKGVTIVRTLQRQLAPDNVGLEHAEPTFLQRISTKASTAKAHRFQNLYGCLNEALLHMAWRKLNKRGAAGVDKETVAQYGENLDSNISQLVKRLKRGDYRSRLIRRKYIPKGNGKERPLGIPVVEDRLLQGAARLLLEAIFETDFLPMSYGYRPKVGAQKAVKELTYELQFGRYGYVVEADIKGFFNTIDHNWLLRMLSERIDDKPFLGLIDSWLKAGILERDGQVIHPQTGTPQGGVISPVLANVYLHYVMDLWFEKVVKPHCQGQAQIIRFADDFVCAFQYSRDADSFYRTLPKRLKKFDLEVAPEKTCIHRFSRFQPSRTHRFTFLGFEFYWEADSKGTPRVWRRTSKQKMRASLKACKEWLKTNRHVPLPLQLKTISRKLHGHYNYFRVVGNSRALWLYYKEVVKLLYKWLNRRSQRRSLTWTKLKRVLERFNLPKPFQLARAVENRELA